MRILLTGAGGFLGARFASLAVAEGHQVLGLGRSARPGRLVELRRQSKFGYQIMDVSDAEALVARARTFQPAVLVHMASPGGGRSEPVEPPALLRAHFDGAVAVAAAAEQTQAAVVWLGCASEYAPCDVPVSESHPCEPASDFGTAKSLAFRAFRRLALGRLRATALRPFHVYGPGDRDDRFTRLAMRAALGRGPNQLGDGMVVRDRVFVDDVARAALQAAEWTRLQPAQALPVVNLGSGRGSSQAAFARAMALVCKAPEFEPGFGAGAPTDPDPPHLVARVELAEQLLGWKASTSVEDGLTQVFADLQARS
ncbi:MAG TPA: NAD(P)-dependent oxidoreductase [Myxococcales bacterium]|nr:NAD(P)-dependent oxidoreductase [Myxococcales bacterium]